MEKTVKKTQKLTESQVKLKEILTPIVKSIVSEANFHAKDTLIGFAYEELIDTVISNYGEDATEMDVMKQYNDLIRLKLNDGKVDLKNNMKFILQHIKRGY